MTKLVNQQNANIDNVSIIPQDKIEEYRRFKHSDYIYSDYSPIIDYKDIENDFDNVLIGYGTDFDVDAVKNSLINIFTVQKGECPGKPNFGNPLGFELFDLIDDFVVDVIEMNIKNAIERYDPRINILEIDVSEFPSQNRIIVKVVYEVLLYDNKIKQSIYLPFAHNSHTYLGGRIIKT